MYVTCMYFPSKPEIKINVLNGFSPLPSVTICEALLKSCSSLTFICAVDAQANVSLIRSSLSSSFSAEIQLPKKVFYIINFNFILQLTAFFFSPHSFTYQPHFLLSIQAYPRTSSWTGVSNDQNDRRYITTHNSNTLLLF